MRALRAVLVSHGMLEIASMPRVRSRAAALRLDPREKRVPGEDTKHTTDDPATPKAHQKRLLVIDDERPVAEFVRAIAEDSGYVVRTAERGAEFQSAFLAFEPTHVIRDIVIPGCDGIELPKYLAD